MRKNKNKRRQKVAFWTLRKAKWPILRLAKLVKSKSVSTKKKTAILFSKNELADMKQRPPSSSVANAWRLMNANSSAQKKLDPLTICESVICPRENEFNCGFSTEDSREESPTLHDELRKPIEAVGSDHHSFERVAIGNDANSLLLVQHRKPWRS